MSSLHNIEIKLYDLQDEFENCESDNNYKKICEELITLASELVEKLDKHYDKLNEIDEYIGENINDQNLIDYESLVWELKKDNLYTALYSCIHLMPPRKILFPEGFRAARDGNSAF